MAAKKIEGGGKTNRVRFVMLEADLSDSNLSQLAEAITTALKPVVAQPARLGPAARIANPALLEGNGDGHVGTDVVDEEAAGASEEPAAASAPPKAPRKIAPPTYLHELLTKEDAEALKAFAAPYGPSKHLRRYVVATAWLTEHKKEASVNVDKMYTAYKAAGWPTAINDWDANFRSLVKVNRMRRVSPGEYTITPIGEASLQEAE